MVDGTRARLGALSAAVGLSAAVLAGCGSSHHSTSAAPAHAPAGTGSSPVAPASAASGTHAAGPAEVCHVISLNLDMLTRVATAPHDPALDRTIGQLHQLGEVAPAEIRTDLLVIADFDQKVLTAMRSGRSPDAIRETPELTAALSHEARWTAAHCSP